jgi:hypothetical protein
MQKLADTITLMAKTGLFFANADGQYTESEKKYITDFVMGIEQVGDLDEALKAQVLDTVNHSYTLDDIVAETKALLDGFNGDEQHAIKKSLSAFADEVIMADGNRCTAEQENYINWKSALAL